MNHELFMRRCFVLAKGGLGYVSPNPLVGAVLVNDGKIIAEGFHKKLGASHAEVVALTQINDSEILKTSTLYVNLEPCSHFGKTPPCTKLIISEKIKNVYFSNLDPNPLVNGKGMRELVASGINVTSGILEKEGFELNQRFFTYHTKKRPYIILKWAQSADGYIAPSVSELPVGKIAWVSGKASRLLVHKWRVEEQAILVGRKTVENDNPKLTAREWTGKNPIRIIIDPNLKIATANHIYDQAVKTIIVNRMKDSIEGNIVFLKFISGSAFFKQLFNFLYSEGIQSVLVEGGTHTIETFISANYWDEARVFTGRNYFHGGVKAPLIKSVSLQEFNFDNDKLTIFRNSSANDI